MGTGTGQNVFGCLAERNNCSPCENGTTSSQAPWITSNGAFIRPIFLSVLNPCGDSIINAAQGRRADPNNRKMECNGKLLLPLAREVRADLRRGDQVLD
jgi:hypothetical protein